MIKICNNKQSNQNEFNQPQQDQYKLKQSKILPYQDQSIHAFYQVEISQNSNPIFEQSNNINIETRLCRLQTSSKNLPRIVKEVDIKLSNGQLITLRDIFTTLPKTISCKSEQILVGSHSSFITSPYQQKQQQQLQTQPQQILEDSTIEMHQETINQKDHQNIVHHHANLKSEFHQKLSQEINLLQEKLNNLPLLAARGNIINKTLNQLKNQQIPIRPCISTLAAAAKNQSSSTSNRYRKINKFLLNKQQKKKQLEKNKEIKVVQKIDELIAGALIQGSTALSQTTRLTTGTTITDDYDDIICGKVSKGLKVEKVCKKSVFRVIRRNIRKERRH